MTVSSMVLKKSGFIYLRVTVTHILLLCVLLGALIPGQTLAAERRIAAYLIVSRFQDWTPEKTATLNNQLNLLTDLILIGGPARTDAQGHVTIDKAWHSRFKENCLPRPDLRVWLCYPQSHDMEALLNNTDYRENYVSGTVQAVEDCNFYGLDWDWEAPYGTPTAENQAINNTVLAELGKALHANGKKLSVASSQRPYPFPFTQEVRGYIARYNVMSYPSYEEAAFRGLQHYRDTLHVPPGKVNLGLGFFGKIFAGQPRRPQWFNYDEIAAQYPDLSPEYGCVPMQNSQGQMQDVYFNNINEIKKITRSALDAGMGVFVWHLGADLPVDHPKSLLKAVKEEINAYGFNKAKVNLALNRKYTCQVNGAVSDSIPSRVFDDDIMTYWEAPQMDNVTIDIAFGERVTFDQIVLMEYGDGCIRDYSIEALVSGRWTKVAAGKSIMANNSPVGYYKTIDLAPVAATYLRVNIIDSEVSTPGTFGVTTAEPRLYEIAVYNTQAASDSNQ